MSAIPSAAEIASIANSYQSFLIDTITVMRTGLTIPCRIDAEKRQARITRMPRITGIQLWRIDFHTDADVRGGDTLIHATKGTFLAMVSEAGQTWQIDVTVFATLANMTVSFERWESGVKVGSTGPVAVTIDPIMYQEALQQWGVQFAWNIIFPLTTQIVDASTGHLSPIVSDDRLIWSGFHNKKPFNPIRQTAPFVGDHNGGFGVAIVVDEE